MAQQHHQQRYFTHDEPSAHHPQERRPSPNYSRGEQQNSRRLTPERSLDQHPPQHRQPFQNNGYRQGGRDEFFEKRRLDRENAPVIGLWPKSPTHAYGEEKKRKKESSRKEERHGTKDKKKHRSTTKRSKSKHERSDDSSTDDSEDRRGSSHKKHKSSRREKRKKKKKRYYSDSEESGASSSDEQEHDRRSRKRKGKSKSRDLEEQPDEEEVWIEKEVATARPTVASEAGMAEHKESSLPGPSRPVTKPEPPQAASVSKPMDDDDDKAAAEEEEEDGGEVGPMPYNHATGKAMDPKEFGRALRPGEGSAMAAFIEAGERIPRRGEIGLTGTEIEKFENVGYVMSGSRHRRMNAVRIRKENQVISAEEKRGILKMQAEEKAKREGQIISSFRELVDTKLQEASQS